MVTAADPAKVTLRSLAGSIRDEFRATALATCTPLIASGERPNAFEIRSRSRLPSSVVRTSWRSVVSFAALTGNASVSATVICALAQLPTHADRA
jgi:hypothetical protein